jgi:diguanylate cyclase (GGDEF)-like protein
LNRRAFFENAATLCKRQARRGEPVAVLMFDLDHFKSINDRFGHSVGDEVLRLFTRVARTSTRANDIIGRFGGEEFVAIVPGGLDVAEKIAERVRVAFEGAGTIVENHHVAATVSIGAAASLDAAVSIDALIARADAALYRAKHDGRNRVVATESEVASERARLIAAARRTPPSREAASARISQRGRPVRPA